MRVPYSWLRELVGVTAGIDDLASTLQERGLLTEEIHRPRKLDHVVVAQVRECRPIEGAKNVQLVVVDDGEIPDREVMCGAFNFAPGDKVPLAQPGAELPNGMEIAVREVKSLGVVSHGMLCAADELGLGDDHSGIMVLDPQAPVGMPLAGVLGLDETVLELEITPNRPDCMSMIGVAREAAAAYGLEMAVPVDVCKAGGPPVGELASVTVEDDSRCPRYVALVVEGITIAPSPAWMARRLLASGVRPINNVVDVTNYVMLETGQPLHAFDLDRLAKQAIIVRTADEGELVTTLDGQDRKCNGADLLICDGGGPVAIAGVMGGQDSEVADSTTRVLIESAHFDAPSVLATSKRLGLRTGASARFERGVDPGGCLRAARRAATLLAELAGGTIARGEIDVNAVDVTPRMVRVRSERVNSILGTPGLEPREMARLLESIEIDVEQTEGFLHCHVPSFRVDIEREIDIIEEVARLFGYNTIPRTLPASPDRIGGLEPRQAAERKLRVALRAAGLDEAQTWSFVSDALYEQLGWESLPRVEILNPLRDADRYLRTSLLPTLLQAAAYNVARQHVDVRLHELGNVASPSDAIQPEETWKAAIVFCGVDTSNPVMAGRRERPYDVFDVKGAVETVGDALGVELQVTASAKVPPGLHPGRSGEIGLDGRTIGWLGELHPQTAAAFDLPRAVAAAEFDVMAVLDAHLGRDERAARVSQFPATTFDLALVMDESVDAGDVEASLRHSGGALLESVRLFDVYRGGQIPEGAKSLAFELRFRADDRTLRDEDVRPLVDAMVAATSAAFGASLRQ